jgi:hypothetical protein
VDTQTSSHQAGTEDMGQTWDSLAMPVPSNVPLPALQALFHLNIALQRGGGRRASGAGEELTVYNAAGMFLSDHVPSTLCSSL